MSDGPSSSDLTNIVQEALGRKLPWWQRAVAWLRRIPANFFRMDGYWGGIIMRDPKNKP